MTTTNSFIHGREMVTPAVFKDRLTGALQSDSTNPIFAGTAHPEQSLAMNFGVMGAPGTGKTLIINSLVKSLAKEGLSENSRYRFLMHDPKNECVAYWYGMGATFENGLLKTLNPFDTRGSAWDLAQDIQDMVAINAFCSVLIPEQKSSGADPFWRNSAREILELLLVYLVHNKFAQWDLYDLVYLGTQLPIKELITTLQAGRVEVTRITELAENTVKSVFAELRTHLKPLKLIAQRWRSCTSTVSISDFLSTHYVLLLGADYCANHDTEKVNQLFMSQLVDRLLCGNQTSLNKKQQLSRTVLILDELPQLGRLEKLPKLLEVGRQMGASVCLGVQDLSQLKSVYGEQSAILLASIGNWAFLRTNNFDTAKWISDTIGQQEVLEVKTSHGGNKGNSTFDEERLSPVGNVSETWNTEKVKSKAESWYPSQQMALPYAGPMNGIEGVFVSPIAGVSHYIIPWKRIIESQPQSDKSVSGYERVDFKDMPLLDIIS